MLDVNYLLYSLYCCSRRCNLKKKNLCLVSAIFIAFYWLTFRLSDLWHDIFFLLILVISMFFSLFRRLMKFVMIWRRLVVVSFFFLSMALIIIHHAFTILIYLLVIE